MDDLIRASERLRIGDAPVQEPEMLIRLDGAKILDPQRVPSSSSLRLYSDGLLVMISGHLQPEQTVCDVRYGPGKTRVYVRWAVPADGLAWDGRGQLGAAHIIRVLRKASLSGEAEQLLRADMRCVWFACGHTVGKQVTARAIFECAPEGASSEPLRLVDDERSPSPGFGVRGVPLPLSPGVIDDGDKPLRVPGEPGPEYYEGKPRRTR